MLRRNGHSGPVAAITAPSATSDATLIGLACAGAVILFAIDLALPLGIALPMSYVALVLIALWSDQRWLTVSFAGSAVLFTVLGFFLLPSGDMMLGLINRGLAIVVIGITGSLVILAQDARQELRALHRFLPMCASCRKIKDEVGDWRGLEQFVEQSTDISFSHGMCPHCVEKWYPELHPELQFRYPELFQNQPN